MIRSKHTFSYDDRLEKVLNSDLFDQLRKDDPNIRDRIHLLFGSLEEDDIGVNVESDLNNLNENCQIVIHTAANVSFDAIMEEYIYTNIMGTKNLLDLCKTMKNLEMFAYISTAYSQLNHAPNVEEEFYDPIIDSDAFIRKYHFTKKDPAFSFLFNYNLPLFMGEKLVNYTMSKNAAEAMVKTYENDFPVVVVRPSVGRFKGNVKFWIEF